MLVEFHLLHGDGMYDLDLMSWRDTLQSLLRSTTQRRTETIASNIDSTKSLGSSEGVPASTAIWQRRYEIVRELGEGGMARVLLAKRRSDASLVCLKFLSPHTNFRTGEQECRALLRLRHPSIVSLIDFSLEDQPPWLATEYVSGSTLQAYLKERSPLPVERVVEILKPVLEALDYAHGEKVIHRDLKPANLMIEVNGGVRMRILDFGIAIIDEFDHTGRLTAGGGDMLGTLLYMAPEQLQGELLTNACDLYAVGLIAWEMLMGQSVFDGKTRAQMMQEKVTRTAGFALSGGPLAAIPIALSSFVEACTLPEPSARPTARSGLVTLQSL
jgi:serine/threonine protein kinase